MQRKGLFIIAVLTGAALEPAFLSQLRLLRVIPLGGTLHHVQGIDVEAGKLWVTSVDSNSRKGYLHRFDLSSGKLEKEVELQDGEKFHPGGIALDGCAVWVPVAEYRRDGKSTIERRDKRTLERLESFSVDDHIGCVAAARELLIGGNWDSRQIYYWDRRGRLVKKHENRAANRYQDLKVVDGELVGSGNLSRDEGAIDWLELNSLQLLRRIRAGKTDRGVLFTNEGMAFRDSKLYLLPEDGPVACSSTSGRSDGRSLYFGGAPL